LSTAPIGIFDSGMGGLTIVKAINNLLPNENIIYFGDTQHNPWGDKSKEAIKNYAIKICDVLLDHGCKAIVIACNTASAVAYKEIQQHTKNIPIINVIDPVVDFIWQQFNNKTIGLIGTKQTISSNNYLEKIQAKTTSIKIRALATPLLVPLIEEGMATTLPAKLILHMYLANPQLQNIEALILGCTHYPLLREQIQDFYANKIAIIDSTKLTALCLQKILTTLHLSNDTPNAVKQIFYISDHNPHFVNLANLFFPNDITLEPFPLWEQEAMIMATD
jgi:glutamate racemase